MGRGGNSQNAMRLLSGALGAHFASFFRFLFLTSILYRFFADFGKVLGGFWDPKMVLTSRFLVFFRICLWRFDFWSNFARFSIKSMAKNIGIFNGFSRRRFINCCLNLLISSLHEI